MRAPHAAANQVPRCRGVGARVRKILEDVIAKNKDQVLKAAEAVGTENDTGFPQQIVRATAVGCLR